MACLYTSTVSVLPLFIGAYVVGMVMGNVLGMWLSDKLRAARLRAKRRARGLA